MSTLDELAARLAVVEARLGILPPDPGPVLVPPARPSGFKVELNEKNCPVLTCDDDPNADAWGVRDDLNLEKPLQAIVHEPRSVRSPLKPGQRRRYSMYAINAAGESLPSEAIDVPFAPPAPSPVPTPGAATPATVLDLSRWYLTLPIADPTGRDTSGPWDVYQPELNSFSHAYFYVGVDDAGAYVQYTAPAKGVTTSGSGATRCELREMTGPYRTDKAAWSFTDGRPHTLTCTLTCDGTSIVGRQEIIVGQIHGPGGTPPLILCLNHTRGGALEVFRQGPRQGDLLNGITPSTRFTYRIDASGGRLRLYACVGDAAQLPAVPQFDWHYSVLKEQSGCYFKSGAYNKAEVGTATTGQAVVRHYRLDLV